MSLPSIKAYTSNRKIPQSSFYRAYIPGVGFPFSMVVQHDLLSAPQDVQVCWATSFLALPCPTTVKVVEQPSHWCCMKAFMGRPPAIRIWPPLAPQSGTWTTTSLHFSQDMGTLFGPAGWLIGAAGRWLSRIMMVAPFSCANVALDSKPSPANVIATVERVRILWICMMFFIRWYFLICCRFSSGGHVARLHNLLTPHPAESRKR